MIINLSTFKNKLYAIVYASLFVRVLAFFVLPTTPSSLGPDEGTYGQLAEWTALGKPVDDFPDFGATLYRSSRAFIWPAAIFSRLGLDELDAVRLTSTLYGFLTILIVVCTLLKSISKSARVANFIADNQKVSILLFSVYVFLPSHFSWSIIGLRESATEFWVVASVAIVYRILNRQIRLLSVSVIALCIAVISVFSARPQVGWVLGLSLMIYFLARIRVKAAQLLAPITLIAVFLGYLPTTPFAIETTESFTARAAISDPSSKNTLEVTPSPTATTSAEKPLTDTSTTPSPTTPSPTTTTSAEKPLTDTSTTPSPTTTTSSEFAASKLCKSEGQKVRLEGDDYVCSNKNERKSIKGLKNPGAEVIDRVNAIPYHHEVNKVGAASVIETQTCPNAGNSRFDKYFCIAYGAPYTTFTFLFRPMLVSDVTSSTSLFAAIENVFWLASIIFVIIMFMRNRKLAFFEALAPSLIFFSIYTVGAGAYEGNMGTAFRHKSLILWVVILLVASTIVATQQRKAQREGISDRS